ncbi:MAG: biotin synthase BioB [Selenomonadaceae bacterium]|nr:biotin synthase BioB [Selenomonadaceae bacterium]
MSVAEEIINGRRLKRDEDLSWLLEAELSELQAGAFLLQKHFRGNHIDLCTIVNGRSGRCSENCKYCAQSAYHHTGVEEYPLMSKEELFRHAKANQEGGANRFSIVTSGRALSGKEFETVLEAYKEMNDTLSIHLCASHGILTEEQLQKLYEAGVRQYHHNIETSKRYFPEICTSHTYDDRIKTIRLAQKAGLNVCSGGIIGMGETWADRIDMAISLSELNIKSIPINSLMAIPGTKLEGMPPLSGDDILRTIALFRFINPEADIRMAAGRKLMPENGATAFKAGASASITGNMLTTSGTTMKDDLEILKKLGLTNAEN